MCGDFLCLEGMKEEFYRHGKDKKDKKVVRGDGENVHGSGGKRESEEREKLDRWLGFCFVMFFVPLFNF